MITPNKQARFSAILDAKIDSGIYFCSRIHKMQSIDLYVKREDESGFAAGGSKIRKYSSLLPIIRRSSLPVALVGSWHSNHILSLTKILTEEGIEKMLFLEKPKSASLEGNALFLSLLLKEREILSLDTVPFELSQDWITTQEERIGKKFFWIAPGGCMPECFFGALTLAREITEQEESSEIEFGEIFVDAGTGLTASALIIGRTYLEKTVPVTVILLAGTKQEFVDRLRFFTKIWEQETGESLATPNYRILSPITGKSFGPGNARVWDEIFRTGNEEGMFLDPVYTGKALLTVRELLKQENPRNPLWIHSGGTLTLAGFQKKILQRLGNQRFFLDNLLK